MVLWSLFWGLTRVEVLLIAVREFRMKLFLHQMGKAHGGKRTSAGKWRFSEALFQ
jgi:hypothetical protein